MHIAHAYINTNKNEFKTKQKLCSFFFLKINKNNNTIKKKSLRSVEIEILSSAFSQV
jgi:hypothetical protein